jgi:hypothetical protein
MRSGLSRRNSASTLSRLVMPALFAKSVSSFFVLTWHYLVWLP